jgi:translation initiation factor 1 (eIF-1/SUI1)
MNINNILSKSKSKKTNNKINPKSNPKLDSDSDSDSSSDSDSDSDSSSNSSSESEQDIGARSDFNFSNNFEEDYYIVNLRVKQRNSRKYITTIENIPVKFLTDKNKLDAFLVKLRNAISSRATYKEEKDEKFIEVSGNKTEIIIKLLCKFLNCSSDSIKVHGI